MKNIVFLKIHVKDFGVIFPTVLFFRNADRIILQHISTYSTMYNINYFNRRVSSTLFDQWN